MQAGLVPGLTAGLKAGLVESLGDGPAPVRVSPTITNKLASSSSVDGVEFITPDVTFAAGAVAYLGIGSRTGAVPTSVTSAGRTWVLVETAPRNTLFSLSVYRSFAAAETTGAITITYGASQASVVWVVDEVASADASGTNGSGATVQAVQSTLGANGTTINATLAALENPLNAMLVYTIVSASTTITPDADFTPLGHDSEGSQVVTVSSQWAIGEATCDPTFPSNGAGIVAIEVKGADE